MFKPNSIISLYNILTDINYIETSQKTPSKERHKGIANYVEKSIGKQLQQYIVFNWISGQSVGKLLGNINVWQK